MILVTTKKGVEGRTQSTYKFKGGVNFAREGYKDVYKRQPLWAGEELVRFSKVLISLIIGDDVF